MIKFINMHSKTLIWLQGKIYDYLEVVYQALDKAVSNKDINSIKPMLIFFLYLEVSLFNMETSIKHSQDILEEMITFSEKLDNIPDKVILDMAQSCIQVFKESTFKNSSIPINTWMQAGGDA